MRNIERDGRWTVLYDDGCDFCVWLLSILLRCDRAGRLYAWPSSNRRLIVCWQTSRPPSEWRRCT